MQNDRLILNKENQNQIKTKQQKFQAKFSIDKVANFKLECSWKK